MWQNVLSESCLIMWYWDGGLSITQTKLHNNSSLTSLSVLGFVSSVLLCLSTKGWYDTYAPYKLCVSPVCKKWTMPAFFIHGGWASQSSTRTLVSFGTAIAIHILPVGVGWGWFSGLCAGKSSISTKLLILKWLKQERTFPNRCHKIVSTYFLQNNIHAWFFKVPAF